MSKENIPPISIVIPTLNEERYISDILASLIGVEEPIDVIVVDGNSSDRTVSIVRSFKRRFVGPSSLRIVSSERGISLQRNTGAKQARHEIIIFADADIVIPSKMHYRKLISTFMQGNYSVAMPGITSRESTLTTRFMYSFFEMWIRIFLMFGKPYFAGSCLLTTKTVFNKIGGFDETLPVAEDINYSFRASVIRPAGFLPVRIPVSARRFIKYGEWKMFWMYLREGFVFATTGRMRFEKISYPFGEY